MATTSKIEWTEATWNPVTGCTKVSPGCKFCYAERISKRLKSTGMYNYRNSFRLTLQPQILSQPVKWKKPKIIFVNSMSDLMHEEIPLEYILKVFQIMHEANWHIYQVLTKRSERLIGLDTLLSWAPNIWMGVSIENEKYKYRIEHLKQTHSRIKFLSLEPLLGPLTNLDLDGIDWVIAGGESGPQARPMDPAWVKDIRNQCLSAKVPFFFKQWGGVNKNKNGRILDGRTWDEMPNNFNIASPQYSLLNNL